MPDSIPTQVVSINTSAALAGCYTQSLAGLAYGHLTKGIATIGSRFRLNTWKRQGIVSAFTPRQQARLQDMFDEADEFIAEYRAHENATSSRCWCGED